MVIRTTPIDLNNYYKTKSDVGQELQDNGFIPSYMDLDYMYFLITDDLKIFLKGGE